MKKKTAVVASSLAAIAVCSSLIAGSTFALFTSESKVDIAVTSGKVAVSATVGDLTATTSLNQEYAVTAANKVAFEAGGYAEIKGGVINLENILPGDALSFPVSVNNDSNVDVKYRVKYTVSEGCLLASGLDVTVNGIDVSGLKTYSSAWETLGSSATVNVTVSLPDTNTPIDNIYQDLTTAISVSVEAVQGNAAVAGTGVISEILPDYSEVKAAFLNGKEIAEVKTGEALKEAVSASGKYVLLSDDVSVDQLRNLDNVTIDADGHEIVLSSAAVSGAGAITGKNVTVKNAKFTKASSGWGLYGGVSYYGCVFEGYAPYIDGDQAIVIDGCTFTNETLQFGERKVFDNVQVTNNVFNVNNVDTGSHAIVFGGDSKEFWESGAKGLVLNDNTFNPINEDSSYIAYYFYNGDSKTAGALEGGNLPVYLNNTYNGNANYAINSLAVENQHVLVERHVADLTDAETTLKDFCPDCYNGKGEHSTHEPYFVMEDGVAHIARNGAWMSYDNLSFSNAKYVYTVDYDLSELTEGSFVAFDCGGGDSLGWADLQLGFKKADGKYIAFNTLFEAQLAAAKTLELSSAKVTAVYTFEKVSDNVIMTLTVNGVEFAVRTCDNIPDDGHLLCWDVYTYATAEGVEGVQCAVTGFSFIKSAK